MPKGCPNFGINRLALDVLSTAHTLAVIVTVVVFFFLPANVRRK